MRVTSGRGKALPFPGLARGFPGGVIEWYYNPNGAPAAMASAAQGIIAAAAQEWAQVCAVHFTYRGESALRMAWDGHNVVSWNPDAYGAAGQTAAYYGTSAVLEDADIVLSPFLDAQGLHAIVAHEWGHALGLTHSDQPGALMSGPPLTSYSGLDAPTDPAEQRALGATGSQWRETGMHWGAWIRATSAAVPVCRFYGDWRTDAATGLRRGPDTHFHTGSDAECSALVQRFPEWIMESAAAFFLELPVNDALRRGAHRPPALVPAVGRARSPPHRHESGGLGDGECGLARGRAGAVRACATVIGSNSPHQQHVGPGAARSCIAEGKGPLGEPTGPVTA